MTRDDHRAQCIKAMMAAYDAASPGGIEAMDPGNDYQRSLFKACMTAAFDALHGIARINPVEATEEMIQSGRCYIDAGMMITAANSAGDLTNPPEEKP